MSRYDIKVRGIQCDNPKCASFCEGAPGESIATVRATARKEGWWVLNGEGGVDFCLFDCLSAVLNGPVDKASSEVDR